MITFIVSLIIFLFGLCVGSFLNVVICRLKTKESILYNRSHCPQCGHILKWYDLIPLISFIWQKGRCRYCAKKISRQYPLVELATGILFIIITHYALRITHYYFFIFSYLLLITCFLIIIFVYDLKHYLIPDKIIYPAIIITFLFDIIFILMARQPFLKIFTSYLLAAIIGVAFFIFLIIITKGKGMGWGDAKLAWLMGLILGWPNILAAIALAFVSGGLIGLGLIIFGKKTFKSLVPFGPFLCASTWLIMFASLANQISFSPVDKLIELISLKW